MLVEKTLVEFVKETGSSSPAPGGGSVSALAGAQAAALLAMYCSLSQKGEKYDAVRSLMEETGRKAEELSLKLLEAVDLDTQSFNRVMDAFRLPRETAEQKEARSRAIQEATIEAARVPLQTATDCLSILKLIAEVAGRGNPGASSDLGVGNLQALAGLTGAAYNVRINLHSIKDEETKNDLMKRITAIQEQGQALWEKNRAVIEKSI